MPAVSVRFLAPGRLHTRQKRAQEIIMKTPSTTVRHRMGSPVSISLSLTDAISELSDRQRALCAIEQLVGFDNKLHINEPAVSREDLAELIMAVNRSIGCQLEKVANITNELHQKLQMEA
jgi:GTP cyclohydrolase III